MITRHEVCSTAVAALLASTPLAAQHFPAQPIRAVVGYAAGGGADGMIRAISNELAEALGQPIIIDNRPGGGTVIATKIVADARPDGYTIYVADPAIYFNPFLLSKLPYNALRDFAPVGPVSSSSTSMLVLARRCCPARRRNTAGLFARSWRNGAR